MFCPVIKEGSCGVYKQKHRIFETKRFEFNLNVFEATSYGYWRFVQRVGNTIYFNDYHFSSQTSNHQTMALNVIKRLNIKGLKLKKVYYREGLNHLDDAIKNMREEIKELSALINTKGTRKATNQERAKRIKQVLRRIDDTIKLQKVLSKSAPPVAIPKSVIERIANEEKQKASEKYKIEKPKRELRERMKRLAGAAYVAPTDDVYKSMGMGV